MLDLQPGDVIDGRYVVETLLGRGGMAEVYRVRHTHLDTQHALKVLTVGGRSLQARLMQEGRVQAALRHPNIVAVSDVVIVEGALGLVLEYVQGPSLDELIARRRLSNAQGDALALGILDGVAAAHALGLIHRDLKPANVMLDVSPRGLTAKVADFGLVKLVADDVDGLASATRSGTAMGTPAYMAPEQIRDAKGVDHRADVWSLGAILYELASGTRCFEAADVLELMVRVATGQRRPVTELATDLPARWVDAIEGALVVDRDHRIPDVATLRARWLADAPVPADPWDAETLAFVRGLGSDGEAPEDFLKRSFRSQEHVRRPRPTAVPASGAADATTPVAPRPSAPPTTYDLTDDTELRPPTTPAVTVVLAPPDEGAATPLPAGRLVAEPAVVTPTPRPPTSNAGRRAAPLLAAAALVLIAGGLGTAGLLGLAGAFDRTVDPKPAPRTRSAVPVAAPAPAEPAPAEPASAEVADPAPVGQDDAAPTPSPAPAPSPGPAPAPGPVPPADAAAAPEGTSGTGDRPPEPTPQAAATGAATGFATASIDAPGMTVSLLDATDRPVDPAALPPGTYNVVAFYEPLKATPVRAVTLGPGERLAVRCVRTSYKCNVEIVR